MICRYGMVSGTVQGVGFRAYVQRKAMAAGLTGFARNLRDGRVEVMLCGEAVAVATVEAEVAIGPPAAKVEEVIWEQRPYREMESFQRG